MSVIVRIIKTEVFSDKDPGPSILVQYNKTKDEWEISRPWPGHEPVFKRKEYNDALVVAKHLLAAVIEAGQIQQEADDRIADLMEQI